MSMEMNKALDLLREIRPSIPKEVLELWCKDRDAFLASHSAAEQAGGDERVKCAVCVDSGKVYDISGEGPWKCYACTGSHEVIGYANGDELDNMLDDRTAVLSPVKTSFYTVPVYREARVALAQPSPDHAVQAHDIPMLIASEHANPDYAMGWNDCRAKIIGASSAVQAEQAEAERPEVVGYLATAEHPKHGQPHKAFNYFKDQHDAQVAHWRERGCTVTEDRLMTVSQHDRIVGALRAKADQLREALEWRKENQAGQRELLRSVTAERDAALARVAELEALMQMNFGELHTARNLLSRLSVSGVNVDAILGGQLQDLVIVPADATLEMVEALKRRLTVTNRGTLLNAGHALNESIAASPFAKKAPEPVMCPRCEGEGTLRTGIDESPSTICKRCDGVGTIAAAPGKEEV
ncbi:TPA: hypothetical protein ACGXEV_000367 [Pseudomonas aeruginosa]